MSGSAGVPAFDTGRGGPQTGVTFDAKMNGEGDRYAMRGYSWQRMSGKLSSFG